MIITEDKVREELKQVVDPELFVNIVDLGLVYQVDLRDREIAADGEPVDGETPPVSNAAAFDVHIEMTLTSPACPAGPQLIQQTQTVLRQLEGVGEVDVKLVMDPPWTPDRMTEDARDQLGIF